MHRVSDSPWLSEQSLLSSEAIDSYAEFGVDGYSSSFSEAISEVILGCGVNQVEFMDGDPVEALQQSVIRTYAPSEELLLTCGDGTSSVHSFEEAWQLFPAEDRESCETVDQTGETDLAEPLVEYDLTDDEREAVSVAGYQDPASVLTLHRLCAQNFSRVAPGDWSENQAREMLGVLELCPKHPDREAIHAAIEPLRDWIAARAKGNLIPSGTHRIPDGMSPGTYMAESSTGFDGCYWERLDGVGNILDNNFMNSGFRAEVTIYPGDFSFYSNRCGEWMRLH